MNDKFLPEILDQYVRSLIVNTKGDPVRHNENWPDYDEVLERFYTENDSDFEEGELELEFMRELLEENKEVSDDE